VVDLGDLARELGLLRSRAAHGTRSARISLEELATRVGEPKSTIHSYLSGKRLAPAQVLDRMVIALGTTPAEQREWAEAWYRVCAHREATTKVATPIAGRATPVPRQLPRAVEHFVGRLAQLAELDRLLAANEPGRVVVLTGTAGVGTTALAVHWAQVRDQRYPDGQLYVDLRGFDPEPPLSPNEVLAGFLRALGVPAADLPPGCAERAALYRSLLADRRLLVVLDNALDSEQVRALLPGGAGCSVLVTSRVSLTGLVARQGAHRIEVEPLAADEGAQLLALAGLPVVAEPEVADRLVELCGGLPLALRLVAERFTERSVPAVSLAEQLAELVGGAGLLESLAAGDDQRAALRAAFSWSYEQLPAPARRAFRLLGLRSGGPLAPAALAAVLDCAPVAADQLATTLCRAHLARRDAGGRISLYPLLARYAAELAVADGTGVDPPERCLPDAVPGQLDRATSPANQTAGPIKTAAPIIDIAS